MHELLVIRHAIAEDRLQSMAEGKDDGDRALTREGCDRMALAARGLARLQPSLELILSSPLKRAEETAAIVARHYRSAERRSLNALEPARSTRSLIKALSGEKAGQIAVVGHEPALSDLIGALICSSEGEGVILKKGGMALLRFDTLIAPGEGTLQWLLTPKQLRLLGKSD